MDRSERKAAASAWKERVAPAGIYRMTCEPTGTAWVGRAKDLDKIENRLRFQARSSGTGMNAALAQAWKDHGDDALVFDVLEALPEDTPDYARDRLLKDRHAAWCAELSARTVEP